LSLAPVELIVTVQKVNNIAIDDQPCI